MKKSFVTLEVFNERITALEGKIDAKLEAFSERIDAKIDALAQIVAKGFEGIYNRLESLENRVENIENRLTNVEQTMATKADKADILNLYDKFVHREEFNELSLRVVRIEGRFDK